MRSSIAVEAGEEAVDEAVDHGVQQPSGVVDRCIALDVALAQRRDRRRIVAVQRDEVAVGVEAVHLDEPVAVLVARRSEDDEEDVAVVVVDLRPLIEPPRVLERERMEAELLAQDLEIAGLRLVDVEPEEVAAGEQLAHPVALEVQPRSALQWTRFAGPGDTGSSSPADRTPGTGGRRDAARRPSGLV